MLTLSRDADDCDHCGASRHYYCADCHGIEDAYDPALDERLAAAAVAYGLVPPQILPLRRQIRTPRPHNMRCAEQQFSAANGGAA